MLTNRRIFEFDDFRVDTGQFLLTRPGQSSPLTPTVFRILVMLLEQAGKVVSKEELIKEVWPDSFVEEGNLNRNVSTLRKALGERPSDHRYIETIPKTGYRFVATVKTVAYQAPAVMTRNNSGHERNGIVGRDAQQKALCNAYNLAKEGRGGVVSICGDVGMGKTALADQFLQDLLRSGHVFQLAHSRCSESLIESEAFMPWIEALGGLAKEPRIAEVMQEASPSWYREITHAGSSMARRMKRELLDFCEQVSSVHPLIVVIDDFQWADSASVDLLAFLATRVQSSRTLIIVCYRMVEMKVNDHPFLHIRSELLSRDACTEICLPLLEPKDVEQYLSEQYAGRVYPPEFAGFLHARTEGNPLFLREILRHGETKSERIENVIQAKLSRLDETHRQLLVTASVQGREFDSAVLAASLQLNPQDVEESLRDLYERFDLIRPIREEQLPDGKYTVRYRFVYAFSQEACYASLAPTRKASLNASLAEAFLRYYGD